MKEEIAFQCLNKRSSKTQEFRTSSKKSNIFFDSHREQTNGWDYRWSWTFAAPEGHLQRFTANF